MDQSLSSLAIVSGEGLNSAWRDLRIFLILFWRDQLNDELMIGVSQFGWQYTDDHEEWEKGPGSAFHAQATIGMPVQLQQQDVRCCRCIETLSLIQVQVSELGQMVTSLNTPSLLSTSAVWVALQYWRSTAIGGTGDFQKTLTSLQQSLNQTVYCVERLRQLWLNEFQDYVMIPGRSWDKGSLSAWEEIIEQSAQEISKISEAQYALSKIPPRICLRTPFKS